MKQWFVQRGFGYVFQDCRGRYDSEGDWEPFSEMKEMMVGILWNGSLHSHFVMET